MVPVVITYGLTVGGALAGVVYPLWGLMVYFILSIIRPSGLWPDAVPPGPYSQVVVIATLVGWALQGFGTWRLGPAKPIILAVCGFWAWNWMSAANAANGEMAWESLSDFSKLVLPVVVGISLLNSQSDLKVLAWTIVGAQTFVALMGHITIYLGSGDNWLQTSGLGGYDNNDLAASMVLMSGFAFGLGISEQSPRRRWVAFACAGLIAHSAILSYSRGALLGFLTTGIATCILVWRERHLRPFIWLALVCSLLLAGPYARLRFKSIFVAGIEHNADSSAESRTIFWQKAWDVACENPFLGLGPSGFYARSEAWFGKPRVVHSLWLQTLADNGFLGLGLLAAAYLLSLWGAWKLFQRPPPDAPFLREAGRMTLLAIPGFCVSAMFVSIILLEQPYYVVLFGAGAIKVADRYRRSTSAAESAHDFGPGEYAFAASGDGNLA
jgi:O-antigen ligase